MNSYALMLLVGCLVAGAIGGRAIWRFWRIGFKSPIDLLNHDLARERARRRRE
jgi:hypothetical protein